MVTAPPGMTQSLQAALEAPVTARRSWQQDVAPAYILVFLLFAYYDELGKQTLSIGGLGWSLLGAVVGGLLCYILLYLAPAMWGLKSRQPFAVVATSTFGAAGSPWVPGLVLGAAHVVWFAVAIWYAAKLGLGGLVAGGLLEQGYLDHTLSLGGFKLESPLFLFVTLFWSLSSALIGVWLVRLVAALMRAYAAFPALMLGAAMLWALPGLSGYRPIGIDPVTAEPVKHGALQAFLMMIQLVFGFFATSGAGAADWGSYTRDARDVRLGGLVGVALAAPIMAAIALLTVAGALGRSPAAPALDSALAAQNRLQQAYQHRAKDQQLNEARAEVRAIGAVNFTLREVVEHGIGRTPASGMLLIFGLALLGPCCYAPFVFGHKFVAVWPRMPRWGWSLLGAVAAWPLIATGAPARAERIFGLLGAALAPVVGAMAADYLRCHGAWPGPRRGVNLAGLIAWATGFAVGLIPFVGDQTGLRALRQFQPASVCAFAVGFLVYALLAQLGLEPRALPAPAAPSAEVAPDSSLPSQY